MPHDDGTSRAWPDGSTVTTAVQRRRALAFAVAQLGDPYVAGENGPDAYDCSGLTQAAYRAAGHEMIQYSVSQFAAGGLAIILIVSGVGQLNRPMIPHFPGIETFRGKTFHSARWDHDYDLAGSYVIGDRLTDVQLAVNLGAKAILFLPDAGGASPVQALVNHAVADGNLQAARHARYIAISFIVNSHVAKMPGLVHSTLIRFTIN